MPSFVARVVTATCVLVFAACGPPPRTESPYAGRVAKIAASPTTPVGAVRAKLEEAHAAEHIELAVGDRQLTVESPNAPAIDTLKTLLVVNIRRDTVEIAGTVIANENDAATKTASLAGHPLPVFLVRAADDVSMGFAFEVVGALESGGAEHVVFGATRPSDIVTKWDDCPFPSASDRAKVDLERVQVQVELDGASRAAIVHVREDVEHGFGGAAALCVARRRFDPGTAGANGKPFRIRFER